MKKQETNFNFYFLESFKIYRIISGTQSLNKKSERIKIFLHWLSIKENIFNQTTTFSSLATINLIKNWHTLLRTLIKYNLLKQLFNSKIQKIENQWLNKLNQTYLQIPTNKSI